MSIDREKLLQAIKSTEQLPILSRMEKVVEYIQQAEDVERHARWLEHCCYMTCSDCLFRFYIGWDVDKMPDMADYKYCPCCGAKMDEVSKDE